MEKQIFDSYAAAGTRPQYDPDNLPNAAVAVNDTLANDTASDDVYWLLSGAYVDTGGKSGHYKAIGLVFSDFAIVLSNIVPHMLWIRYSRSLEFKSCNYV